MSTFKVPPKKIKRKFEGMRSVNFRIPPDLLTQFNEAVRVHKLTGQDLVDQMVRHCLKDMGYK